MQRLDAAAAGENRRRGINLAEERRIVRLPDRDEPHAEPARGRELPLDLLGRGEPDRPLRAAAAGELRQRLERGPRAAISVDQRPKGARPDILRADETQPVEQLRVG